MSESVKPLRLNCPVCETRLRIGLTVERFACLNCGTELTVVKEGGLAKLVPTAESAAEMSSAQQELIEVSVALKDTDDMFGAGCAVATLAITLVSCILLAVSISLSNQILFWGTLFLGLGTLLVVLFLFVAASTRRTAGLVQQRDTLQTQIGAEPETEA